MQMLLYIAAAKSSSCQIILKHVEAPKAVSDTIAPLDQQSPSKNAFYVSVNRVVNVIALKKLY